jgi:hypothetical protein
VYLAPLCGKIAVSIGTESQFEPFTVRLKTILWPFYTMPLIAGYYKIISAAQDHYYLGLGSEARAKDQTLLSCTTQLGEESQYVRFSSCYNLNLITIFSVETRVSGRNIDPSDEERQDWTLLPYKGFKN